MVGQGREVEKSPLAEFIRGGRDTLPLMLGAIPFGIIFGTLATSSGLSFSAAIAMSAIVYAGSAQFVALGLLSGGASLIVIALTTLVINFRHVLYSLSLALHIRSLSSIWKLFLAFGLADEVFVIAINRYNSDDLSAHKHWYFGGSAVFLYLNWQACTFIGLTLGQAIPDPESWSLDFAISITFIGMIVTYLRNTIMVASAVASGVVALIAHSLPNKLGLLIAVIAGITAGLIGELINSRLRKE